MTDIISLCPDYITSSIHISNKKTNKGIYWGIEYYVAFERKNIHGYFNEEQKVNIITFIVSCSFFFNNSNAVFTCDLVILYDIGFLFFLVRFLEVLYLLIQSRKVDFLQSNILQVFLYPSPLSLLR